MQAVHVLCTSASVCCGSGRVCVFVSISGALRCRFSLSCVNVEWWLRTVDLVCLAWASSGGVASCCMGLVRDC